MRILVWPADQSGCGHSRLILPALALAEQDADVTVTTVGPTVLWGQEWHGKAPPLDAQVVGVRKPDADVVVLQRPGRRIWLDVIRHLQQQGVRVVVDVDDAFWTIPRANTSHDHYDPRRNPHHNWQWIDAACGIADLVTVTTPALAARYGRHGRVAVLPNLVPDWYLKIESDRSNEAPMIGWSGTVDTHPHDLEVTAGAVHRAVAAVENTKVGVIGTGVGVANRLKCTIDRVTGWLPFAEYAYAMASIDVGIVPLHASPFNDAKSALKGSEFAAVGVVPVMSPTPDNRRLHELGVGVLADSPGQWRRQLTRLARETGLRQDLAAAGRDVMAGQTYELHCGRWFEAWSSTLDRQAVA